MYTKTITHIAGFLHFVFFLHVWRPGTGEFKDSRCHLTHAYKKRMVEDRTIVFLIVPHISGSSLINPEIVTPQQSGR